MNIENIAKLLELSRTDDVLAAKVQRKPGETPRELAERLSTISDDVGAPFTPAEFLHAITHEPTELTATELDSIAGGIQTHEQQPLQAIRKAPEWGFSDAEL